MIVYIKDLKKDLLFFKVVWVVFGWGESDVWFEIWFKVWDVEIKVSDAPMMKSPMPPVA